jgi:hypothetical protein
MVVFRLFLAVIWGGPVLLAADPLSCVETLFQATEHAVSRDGTFYRSGAIGVEAVYAETIFDLGQDRALFLRFDGNFRFRRGEESDFLLDRMVPLSRKAQRNQTAYENELQLLRDNSRSGYSANGYWWIYPSRSEDHSPHFQLYRGVDLVYDSKRFVTAMGLSPRRMFSLSLIDLEADRFLIHLTRPRSTEVEYFELDALSGKLTRLSGMGGGENYGSRHMLRSRGGFWVRPHSFDKTQMTSIELRQGKNERAIQISPELGQLVDSQFHQISEDSVEDGQGLYLLVETETDLLSLNLEERKWEAFPKAVFGFSNLAHVSPSENSPYLLVLGKTHGKRRKVVVFDLHEKSTVFEHVFSEDQGRGPHGIQVFSVGPGQWALFFTDAQHRLWLYQIWVDGDKEPHAKLSDPVSIPLALNEVRLCSRRHLCLSGDKFPVDDKGSYANALYLTLNSDGNDDFDRVRPPASPVSNHPVLTH